MKFLYSFDIWNHNDFESITPQQCYEIDGRAPEDQWDYETLAEKCAEDYYNNHDGWEHRSWPNGSLILHIFDSNMKHLGKYDVYLEFEPSFTAYKQNEK